MPEYDFLDIDSGERVLLFSRMADAVEIGAEVTRDGRRLKRLAPTPGFTIKAGVAHVSNTLPRGWNPDGSPVTPGASSYTPEGQPIIESQADISRIERLNPNFTYGKGLYED